MTPPPRALILSLNPGWIAVSRLPGAFKAAGFAVCAAGYRDSLLLKSRHVDARLTLARLRFSLARLVADMAAWRPDLVIPGDDEAAKLAGFLADGLAAQRPDAVPAGLRTALEASLGARPYRKLWGKRQQVQEMADAIGLRVPPSAAIATAAEAERFARRHGYPVILKRDDTGGGGGVRIARDAAALAREFAGLADGRRDRASRRVRLRRFLLARGHGYREIEPGGVSIHGYVEGRPAMCGFAAWEGRLLGRLVAFAERTHPGPRGPSTVVRFAEHAEMAAAAETFVRHVGYSGLGGLDFLVDDAGRAHLIEFNARPISISHMGRLVGIDLIAALARALTGGDAAPLPPLAAERIVAHFPQEWYRDPASEYLRNGLIDMPWDDPPLLDAFAAGFPRDGAAQLGDD